MAAYNGSAFIVEQIESILRQLGPDDELIIVDDCSSDDTCKLIRGFADPRIELYVNDRNLGVNSNFEKAILKASGEIIFLSDQDDIWLDGRLESMKAYFSSKSTSVVASNFQLIDSNGNALKMEWCPDLESEFDGRRLANLLGIMRGNRNYYGCAMAFRSAIRPTLLPFPKGVESHDLWLAIYGNIAGGIRHMEKPTLLHRVHGSNASIVSRPLLQRILARILFSMQVLTACWRLAAWPQGRH